MRARAENCLNNYSGVFACWVNFKTIEKRIMDSYGIYVVQEECKTFHKNIERIIYVMRRHHYFKDFNYPTCRMKTMIAHDEEYAKLMEYFVEKFKSELLKAGYTPERGDGCGFCYSSDNKPFLMFGVGKLYYKGKNDKHIL
jgi:hypothetical protein